MAATVLRVNDLAVEYDTANGPVRSLDSATLSVDAGQIVAVVGESGSGKSTLGMAIARLLAGNARYVSGSIELDGADVLNESTQSLRATRRSAVGYIFQNPVSALDPTRRVRDQIVLGDGQRRAFEESLVAVGLTDVPRVLASFPHQLSGGMAQRVGIAMALLRSPSVLVADEPTASVDATGRERLMEILVERCRESGSALLMLTHDLHAVQKFATHIAVMYGGRVVEFGPAALVIADPAHPYTRALLHALPGEETFGERLEPISGSPPVLRGPSAGCAFAPRCPVALGICETERPVLEVPLADLHDERTSGRVACCHVASGRAEVVVA